MNYPNHNSTLFRRGGDAGTPAQLWNDKMTRDEIEDTYLRSGEIELLGMTIGEETRDENFDAYQNWIDLATSYNPNISIFLVVFINEQFVNMRVGQAMGQLKYRISFLYTKCTTTNFYMP